MEEPDKEELLQRETCSRRYTTLDDSIDGPPGDGTSGVGQSVPAISPLTPPHWLHRRHESYASLVDNKPTPITLEDHTEGPSALDGVIWAQGVYIEDYVLVSGNIPNVGDFIVWICRIDTIDGSTMIVRRRYSQFYELRQRLLMTFPKSAGSMPLFPPKSVVHRFRPQFLEKRRIGLGYWLTCILLNPEFCSSPVTKDFIFA